MPGGRAVVPEDASGSAAPARWGNSMSQAMSASGNLARPEGHASVQRLVSRRTFLVAGGLGFGGLHLPSLVAAGEPVRRPVAKSTILIWLSGGASHIDTWDLKPDAPVEYRGEFQPIATSAPGVR